MSIYEFGLLGPFPEPLAKLLSDTLREIIAEFHLSLDDEVVIRTDADFLDRNKKLAAAALFYCDGDVPNEAVLAELIEQDIPVIPVVAEECSFSVVPAQIAGANGLKLTGEDGEPLRLVSAGLECIGLLREQRRVFVSYRREESRSAALQMHDVLSGRGFDVFLDTHDIRFGEPFQEVLWHRLCNCDVVIMLDTPGYFESRWTRQEIARAHVKHIHVLRVIWPDHQANHLTDLAETIYLDEHELLGGDGPLIDETTDQIAISVERLRSRSIAARFKLLTGKLKSEARQAMATIEGIGAFRATGIKLLNGKTVWAYPVVGIPSAELINDISEKAREANGELPPILVYDAAGIQDRWSAHLEWLNSNIGAVDMLKVSDAGWELAAWGDDQ